MKTKFDAKVYRLAYRRDRYVKKIKVRNLNLYSAWKNADNTAFKKFDCIQCSQEKECFDFYISHLRHCLVNRNFSILKCKVCHNKRKKALLPKSLSSCKIKSPSPDPIPELVKVWLQEEKLKKETGTPPLIRATLNQSIPNALPISSLDSETNRVTARTLSDEAPPRALGQ
jgi:hypothetical protein